MSACRPEDFIVIRPDPKNAPGLRQTVERGAHYCTCCGTLTTKPLVKVSYRARQTGSIKEVCAGCLRSALKALGEKP